MERTAERRNTSLSIAVIGAGPAGLVAMKELLAEGHRVRCLEQQRDIGGTFHPEHGICYDTCELTVSNYFMAFSSLPPEPHEERRFWTYREYFAYLSRYARTFDLRRHITFQVQQLRISPRPEGGFTVDYSTPEGHFVESFDGVAICTGAQHDPNQPHIEGTADFGGELVHSSTYRNAEPFRGRRVVCVGIGETAADVVHEVSNAAASCVLSIHQYPAVVPKHIAGHPSDALTARATYSISRDEIDERVMHVSRKDLEEGDDPLMRLICEWNIKNGGMARQFLTKNDAFLPDVLAGRIKINDSGIARLSPRRVHFKDGEEAEADCILFNTGFQVSFPFLDGIEVGHVRRLFRHMILPEAGPRLAFIGFARPAEGGVPACSEMQSRVFARLCSGKLKLPAPDVLRSLTDEENRREAARFDKSARISILVPYVQYMDAMAELLGCSVLTDDLKERDPDLYRRLLFGSLVSTQYRLHGEHALPELAREVIFRLPVVWPESRMREYEERMARFKARDAVAPCETEHIYLNAPVLAPAAH